MGDWLLSMAGSEGERGFSKGMLHYMKKNAEGDHPFTLDKYMMMRLDQWDQSADHRGSTVDARD
jgi:CRISPR-associated protein Cas1